MFETHYEIDQSFQNFDPNCLRLVTDPSESLQVFYLNLLIHQDGLGKQVHKGSHLGDEELSSEEAISLWQMCYLSTHESYDPEDCAYIYRVVNAVCHSCFGEGAVLTNDELVECTVCNGTRRPGHD